jgi:hypothetical protein
VSPRRQTFEAKFDKFLINKSQKEDKEARSKALKKEDFDVVTRNCDSPNKRSKNFKDKLNKTYQAKEGEELIP